MLANPDNERLKSQKHTLDAGGLLISPLQNIPTAACSSWEQMSPILPKQDSKR